MQKSILAIIITLLFLNCSKPTPKNQPDLLFSGEKHFKSIRQLTFGGTNAEAYWSYDGKWLTFQHKGKGILLKDKTEAPCDQIFTMKADGTEVRQISNGKGRTTCSYFFRDSKKILYSSTFGKSEDCPTPPDMSQGYVWPIYPSYKIYTANLDGSNLKPMEPQAPLAYHAETVTCADGSVLFTSNRDGDLELYIAHINQSNELTKPKRLTHSLGYDGGGVFSPDCKQIAWRASRPHSRKDKKDYLELLKQNLVRPTRMQIWTAHVDGSAAKQVTSLAGASFAPAFTADGKKIIFSSNFRDPKGRHFDLYWIGLDGSGLEQITFSGTFDSFPMFSPDGKYLAFSSNRNAKESHETNVFVAEWVL